MDEYIPFGSPLIEEEEIEEVADSLRSGWLGAGPKVARFEKMFADYIGVPHACAVSSCTAGLHLALVAAEIGPGDEVITSPMTFASTANVIEHVGARPVFVDIDRNTMNIDVSQIPAHITPRTRALLPVHCAGRPCDMDPVLDIAAQHGLLVIEDAAHCIEGAYKGRKIGTIGDMTAFSFYVTKNLATGEGGMVTTRNKDWAERIKLFSSHGLSKTAWNRYAGNDDSHYQVIVPGYSYNMMDLQAAIGIHQLPRLPAYLVRREHIWQRYDEAFAGLPVTRPSLAEVDTIHARHLYTLLVDREEARVSRDEVRKRLHDQNVGSGIHFISLHMHPYYSKKYGFTPEDYPNAAFVSERTLSLPLSAKLTDSDVSRIIDALRKALEM